jgi:hypothetical protein
VVALSSNTWKHTALGPDTPIGTILAEPLSGLMDVF